MKNFMNGLKTQHERTSSTDKQRRPGYTFFATTVIAENGAVSLVGTRPYILHEIDNL